MRQRGVRGIALFIIYLILFLPFSVSSVFAAAPSISGVQVQANTSSAIIRWETDVVADSSVGYGIGSADEQTSAGSASAMTHEVDLTPLQPNTNYHYQVTSCVAGDCSTSSPSSFSTSLPAPPAQITGLENTEFGITTATISWEASESEFFASYRIYRNSALIANISEQATTQFMDSGLQGSTTYAYEVSAVDQFGAEGQKSAKLYVTTEVPDMSVPTLVNLRITSISPTSATLGWETDEETNASVNYGNSSALGRSVGESSMGTSHQVTLENLTQGVVYYYTATSCDESANCDQSEVDSFVPSEMLDLHVDVHVPPIYHDTVVPVNGTATPRAKVKFFVNGVYKALIGPERNTDGAIAISVPGFNEGNNTLKASVEDSLGNAQEQSFSVFIDTKPPVVAYGNVTTPVSSETTKIKGSTNEAVTVEAFVTTSSAQDATAPGRVTGLHADEALQNSVTLAWVDVNDSDFKEYIIYRDNVPIDTAVQSPYDDSSVDPSSTYTYAIAAVDTSCNIGDQSTITVNTQAGNYTQNQTIEPIANPCLDESSTPVETIEVPAGTSSFNIEVPLNQGMNEVTLKATDKAGNSVQSKYFVYMDSEAPQIIDTNIDELTPSYVREVTITGQVSEQATVYVYINEEPDTRNYREEEVNESISDVLSGRSVFKARTNENGSFSVDVSLRRDPDYAYDTDDQTRQTRSIQATTSDAWSNNIRIVAVDDVGLESDPEEGEILYALCGSGNDWSIQVTDVSPTELVPRYIIEGLAQVGFTVDVVWKGVGERPGIADIDVTEGYPFSLNEKDDSSFDTNWVTQLYDDQWSDDYDKGYVLMDLKSPDIQTQDNLTTYELEKNLSDHRKGECFNAPFSDSSVLKDAGCVRIPLTIKVDYDHKTTARVNGELREVSETKTQKQCLDVEIMIQPRVPPDVIPNKLLENSIELIDGLLEGIDAVLEPLETTLKATMITCFGSWAVLYVKKASEGVACWNVDVDTCSCTASDTGVSCSGDNGDDCASCVEAKTNTKSVESIMKWTCDRIFCPAVPSYEKYVEDNYRQNENSNCYEKNPSSIDWETEDGSSQKSVYSNSPKGLVGPRGKAPLEPKKELCDEEYMAEWGSGCVVMDEFEESKRLADPKYDTSAFIKAWRGVADFSLCRPGDSDRREVNLGDDGWYILEPNPAYDAQEKRADDNLITNKNRQLKYLVWEGIAKREIKRDINNKIISDELTLIKGQQLTDGPGFSTNAGLQPIKAAYCDDYTEKTGYNYRQSPYWPKFTASASIETTTSQQDDAGFALGDSGSFDLPEDYAYVGEVESVKTLPVNVVAENKAGTITYYYKDPTYGTTEELRLDDTTGTFTLVKDQSQISKEKQIGPLEVSDTPVSVKKIRRPDGSVGLYNSDDGSFVSIDSVYSLDKGDTDSRVSLNDWKEYGKTTAISTKKSVQIYVPESIVHEACVGNSDEYLVNPVDSIWRSFQCACLSALSAYLNMWKKILTLIKNCFETILVTGDGSAGVCQATLSYYVCDMIYYLFSCFKDYQGFGSAATSNPDDSGLSRFFKGIVGAGAEVQKTVQSRYGTTNMYQVMFVDKKVIQSMCLSFFGADTDLDLTALAEQTINSPIPSTVSAYPAERRFTGYNPVDGITNHVYHIGLLIVSGSDDMGYTVDLVCSNDNSCDSRYFEGGRCDCSYGGAEVTRDITNSFGGNGLLDLGEVLNEEVFVTASGAVEGGQIRYDKVRVSYDYLDASGKIDKKEAEVELTQVGGAPLASCAFDITAGFYRCGIFQEATTMCFVGQPTITVLGTDRPEQITDGQVVYNAVGKRIRFGFETKRDTSEGDTRKKFFGVVTFTSGGREIYNSGSIEMSDDGYFSISPEPTITESWFGTTSSTQGYFGETAASGFSSVGLTIQSASGDKDVKIDVTSGTSGTFTIAVSRGTIAQNNNGFTSDGAAPSTCTVSSGSSSINCGGISFGITSLKAGSTLFKYTATANSQTTGTQVDKTIEWSVTIYRPSSDNKNSKSNTITKCSGQQQQYVGSFRISQESSETTSQATQTQSKNIIAGTDAQGPVIRNIKIDGVAPTTLSGSASLPYLYIINQGNVRFTITGEIEDVYEDTRQVKATGISSATIKVTGKGFSQEIAAPFTGSPLKATLQETISLANVPQEEGSYSVTITAKDSAGNPSSEPVVVDGLWFGNPCGDETGLCTSTTICNRAGFDSYDDSSCTGGLRCCILE